MLDHSIWLQGGGTYTLITIRWRNYHILVNKGLQIEW